MGTVPRSALTANAAFSQILSNVSAEGVGKIENGDGQKDVAADSIGGLFGENAQEPALFEFPEECIFDQATKVIEVDDSQGVIDGQAGQEDL